MSNPVKSLPILTGVHTGNAVLDACYATPNIGNFQTWFGGGRYYDEKSLKYCLSLSGEPNW